MTSAVAISNLALDEIPHPTIVSLEENTRAAEVLRRQLPMVLGEIMESGEWNFGIRRVALAQIANDREGLWRYAYAVPTDLALPLRITSTRTVGSEFLLPGQTLAADVRLTGDPIRFDFEGLSLWSNEEGAILEYVTATPAWTSMSKRFMRLLSLTLAARIVVPITKDHDRKRALLQEAELFGQRALASSLNANHTQQAYGDDFIPSSLMGYFGAPE